MRKLFALLFVASAFTFASCGEKHESAATDSTATAPAMEEAPVDTTAHVDSAAHVDTTSHAAPAK